VVSKQSTYLFGLWSRLRYSVYHNSHDASVSAGVPVPFQLHHGNCDKPKAFRSWSIIHRHWTLACCSISVVA